MGSSHLPTLVILWAASPFQGIFVHSLVCKMFLHGISLEVGMTNFPDLTTACQLIWKFPTYVITRNHKNALKAGFAKVLLDATDFSTLCFFALGMAVQYK
jgi:hypothetical protein